MSTERLELKRLARLERSAARMHARRIPMHASRAASALAEKHPILMAGGAAAIGVLLMSGRRSKTSGKDEGPSITMLVGALAVRMLPEALRAMNRRRAPSTSSPSAAGSSSLAPG